MTADGYLPIEDHGRNYVKPDFDRARELIRDLEDPAPHVQPWDEAIGVYLEDGTKVFALYADGSVECPDNSKLPEAAVIFFREVCKIATLQGYTVRKPPESQDACTCGHQRYEHTDKWGCGPTRGSGCPCTKFTKVQEGWDS